MAKEEKSKNSHRHSKFGFASIIIGAVNVLLFVFYSYRFAMWIMENYELAMQPGGLDGMQIPAQAMKMISFLFLMILIGFLTGICGFFEKKRKLFPIIGVSLNGMLLLIALMKL